MITTFLWVCLGGALGSILRFSTTLFFTFSPLAILVVNCLGSFLLGFLIVFFPSGKISTNVQLFLTTGFCGGFTTFSSLMLEIDILSKRSYWFAVLYSGISLILGLTAVGLGSFLGNLIKK